MNSLENKDFNYEKEEDFNYESTPKKAQIARKKWSTKRSRRESYNKHLRKIYAYSYYRALKKLDYDDPASKVVRSKSRYDGTSFYKAYSNRKVRRYVTEIPKGASYKRIFDYWWTID